MKATLYFLTISCAGVLAAQAATVISELPDSGKLPYYNQAAWSLGSSTQPDVFLDKLKSLSEGIYAGTNGNNNLSNWGVNGEGTWTNTDNIGSITLCGRLGVEGSSLGMVLAGPQAGSYVSSIAFSCNSPASVITNYSLVLGIYDSEGVLVQSLSKIESFTFGSSSTQTSISLDMTAAPLVWQDGYKLAAGIYGGKGAATTAYNITGIQVSYDIQSVPEPAAASLGLFGLGALLMKRRR